MDTPPTQQLPGDDAGGPDVAASVDGFCAGLLWGHVRKLALDQTSARLAAGAGRFGDTKIRQATNAVHANQDIVRRHVAVHQMEQ
jgi:hypothetical protein